MKNLLLATLLLFSINGFAYNWEKITETEEGHSLYVDVDTIKKHNGLVYFWSLNDLLEPFGNSLGNSNSVISKYKVDCGEEKVTALAITFYSESMGNGRIVREETPNFSSYPKPNSVGYRFIKFICDNVR